MAHWFTERIEQLCKERKLSKSALGQAAGLSHATIGKWIQAAEAGNFSLKLKDAEKLSKFSGRPVEWFMVQGSSEPPAKAAEVISAADLERTALRLTQYAKIQPDRAWLLMRGLVAPDAESLYFAALDVLESENMVDGHRDDVGEMKRGAAPVRRVKTS